VRKEITAKRYGLHLNMNFRFECLKLEVFTAVTVTVFWYVMSFSLLKVSQKPAVLSPGSRRQSSALKIDPLCPSETSVNLAHHGFTSQKVYFAIQIYFKNEYM
jgi:hypothetical protein